MPESLQAESCNSNEFILQAAIDKEPIFDSFRKLCEIQGNQKLDYVDFEWRYYQYFHGNRDLSIEKSSENSSQVTFFDLPMIVLQRIVKESALPECQTLRKVSSHLRNLVDSTEIRCRRIDLVFLDDYSRIDLENLRMTYEERVDGCRCEIEDEREPEIKTGSEIAYTGGNINFPTMMLIDVCGIVKHPKLKIDTIRFEVRRNGAKPGFAEFIGSWNFQLDARELDIFADGAHVLPIFQFMKSRILEKITFFAYFMTLEQFDEIAETEQWKGAKMLCWDGYPSQLRVEKLLHFEEIRINRFGFDEKHLFIVRDLLLRSAHLESCHLPVKSPRWYYDEEFDLISFDRDDDDDDEEIIDLSLDDEEDRNPTEEQNEEEDRHEEPMDKDEKEKERVELEVDRILSQDSSYNAYNRRYSVPMSRDYFQFEFEKDKDDKHVLTIKRVARK